MSPILDALAAPVIALIRNASYQLIGYFCLLCVLLLALTLFVMEWIVPFSTEVRNSLIALATAGALYAQWALLRFLQRSSQEGDKLLDHAHRGQWNFDRIALDPRWANASVVPLVCEMGKQVSRVVFDVTDSSDRVLEGAGTVNTNSKSLATRAEEIASMLEETASGMEEFAATIERNAANCEDAQSRAVAAAEAASQAARQSSVMMSALEGTMMRSRRITDILSLIEDIANQTNMLALSASIEAARAGENGRGFALVANEVRELSQRSAQSSKVVRERVEAAGGQMRDSVRVARATRESMLDIESRVVVTRRLLDDIALASSEQNTGIAQVKMAIEHMATLTQSNAAMVDEVARTAQDIEREAQRIDNSLGLLQSTRYADQEKCVTIAQRAIAHVKAVGLTQAGHDIAGSDPRFRDGDIYCVLTRNDGVVLAHGGNNAMAGRGPDMQDHNGFYFGRELARIAVTRGTGWLSYRMPNPRTGKPQDKLGYIESIPGHDAFMVCGTFKRLDRRESQTPPK